MKRIHRIAILSLFGVFFGCDDQSPFFKKLDSPITITIKESHDYNTTGEPKIVLKMATVITYECSNYQLAITEQRVNNVLRLNIQGISTGGICLTALGPATASIELNEAIEQLEIRNGEFTDRYDIDIDDEKIEVIPVEENFSSILDSPSLRFPLNSLACICGTQPNYSTTCDDFRELLKNQENLTEFQFTTGIIPYPDSSSGHWINTPSTFYTYTSENDFRKVGELLQRFSDEHITANSGVSIQLINWKNESFRSSD